MANANTPRGIVPYRRVSGEMWNGAANLYYVAAGLGTAIFQGDPVVPTGTSDANGIAGVTLATAGVTNYLLGSMVSIVNGGDPQITVTRDLPPYRPASTAEYILVCDDPDMLYWAQEDSVGGAMSVNSSMDNVDLISGVGSTATSYSGWQLDSSSAGNGATKQMRILRPYNVTDNQAGLDFAKWLVKINLHSILNPAGV